MKTKYKFIHFVKITDKPKTFVWSCRTQGGSNLIDHQEFELGKVQWYPIWRQYCFFTTGIDAVYSVGCLEDINDFIKQLSNK